MAAVEVIEEPTLAADMAVAIVAELLRAVPAERRMLLAGALLHGAIALIDHEG